ncbi:MAG: hypothetical protein ABIP91_03450 [Sphingomicrobium sp.]
MLYFIPRDGGDDREINMRKLALALLAMGFAVPAAAESPHATGTSAQAGKKTGNPNEVVCEKIEIIGSRLNSKRVCATRAQWAEQRLRDRMEIDKAQRTGRKGE